MGSNFVERYKTTRVPTFKNRRRDWIYTVPPTPALTYGRWVGIRNSGTLQRAAWSNDGITWATASTPNSYSYQSVDFSPELGLYVAVASDAQTNNIMSSTNGVAWTARTKPTNSALFAVKWCAAWNKFLATSTANIFSSSDGINWATAFTHSGGAAFAGAGKSTFADTPTGWVFATFTRPAPVNAPSQICYSTDGTTFATYSVAQSGLSFRYATQIAYLKSQNRFVGIAPADDTNQIIQTTGSITSGWTNYTENNVSGGTRYGISVGGSATNSAFDRFLISNSYGQTTTAATKWSSLGASGSWTASTHPSAIHYPYAVEYAPSINQWVVCKVDAGTVYTSVDGGLTFTSRTAFSNILNFSWGPGVRTTGYKQGSGIT